MPASQPGSGTWGPPRPLAGQRDGASGDRNVERASAGGTSGDCLDVGASAPHGSALQEWLPQCSLGTLTLALGPSGWGRPVVRVRGGSVFKGLFPPGGWAMRERWTSPVQSWLRLHPGRSHRLCYSESV